MRRAIGLLLLGLSSACAGPPAAGDSASSEWEPLAEVTFDGAGETPWVPLPQAANGLALRASAEAGVCFELSGARDDSGEALAQRFAGPDCEACSLRSSVAAEAGLFVLPAARQVRFATLDCETLNPIKQAAGTLHLEARVAGSPASGTLPLRLLIPEDSNLYTDPAERERLLDALTRELAATGITPVLEGVEALEPPTNPIRFHAGDPSELAALVADRPADPASVRVVIAGCLEYADPLFGPPITVEGYTPRVVGGAGLADAVFLPAQDCTSSLPLDASPEARGRTLAHELGHYLGLFHTDQDSSNLMNPNPSLAASHGLTPEQVDILWRHPLLRESQAER